jgi:hypothetical protein
MTTKQLMQAEREQIYLRKKNGETLQTIANEIGISYECARKRWRRGKQEGLAGLVFRNIWTKHKEVPRPTRATAVHEIWQVDHQESHRLGDGSIATVCNIRNPYGAAMIASHAFEVKTEKR